MNIFSLIKKINKNIKRLFIGSTYVLQHPFLMLRNRNPQSFKYYLSITAIVKNEASYIAEWIEYHLIVGVTKFYIYDNESEDNLLEVLQPYVDAGIVDYCYFPGYMMQRAAYNDALKKARKETYWLAFIDLDEFIVPISTQTIPEFLKDFEKYPGVEINNIIYGSSAHKTKEKGLVIERFKDHSDLDFSTNRHVKTIANPRLCCRAAVHEQYFYFGRYSVDTNKKETRVLFKEREGAFDKIRINHYFTKSFEEFLHKRGRGRAASGGHYDVDGFYALDKKRYKKRYSYG